MITMQEMNSCVENTSSDLVKVMTETSSLDMEYNKVKQEHDEVA
jgi:hypothetical protein